LIGGVNGDQGTMIEYIDRPPGGFHPLDVMQQKTRSLYWVALLIDVHPEDFKACACQCQQRRLRIPGKHKTWDEAWEALQAMIATRH
jgi:hypothetical protein